MTRSAGLRIKRSVELVSSDKNAKVTIAAYGSDNAIAVDVTVGEEVPRVILRALNIVSSGAETVAPSDQEALTDTAAVASPDALYVVGGQVVVDSCDISGRVFVSGATCTLRDCVVRDCAEDGLLVNWNHRQLCSSGKVDLINTTIERVGANGISAIEGACVTMLGGSISAANENGVAAVGQPGKQGPQTSVTLNKVLVQQSGSRGIWAVSSETKMSPRECLPTRTAPSRSVALHARCVLRTKQRS